MSQLTIQQLNELAAADAAQAFLRCCGCKLWSEQMASARPFDDLHHVLQVADEVFDRLSDDQWREAFDHHPKIGDINSLKAKYAGNREWSAGEQAKITEADEQIIHDLAAANEAYERRFGFIFIICASGKSAAEMLAELRQRLPNDPGPELIVAAGEQRKITRLRIRKLTDTGS